MTPGRAKSVEGQPDPAPDDDTRLAGALRSGDAYALATLYDRHAVDVYTIAKRVLRTDADAESIVSDVFFEIWSHPDRFDPSRGSARTYLVMLARSRAIDRIRSAKLRSDHANTAAQEAAASGVQSPTPAGDVARREESQAIDTALGELPDEQATPIRMAFFDGLTHLEIAESLREPLGTVKSRIRAGMQKLRDKLSTRSIGGERGPH